TVRSRIGVFGRIRFSAAGIRAGHDVTVAVRIGGSRSLRGQLIADGDGSRCVGLLRRRIVRRHDAARAHHESDGMLMEGEGDSGSGQDSQEQSHEEPARLSSSWLHWPSRYGILVTTGFG